MAKLTSSELNKIAKEQSNVPSKVVKKAYKRYLTVSSTDDDIVKVSDFDRLPDLPSGSIMHHVIGKFAQLTGATTPAESPVDFGQLMGAVDRYVGATGDDKTDFLFSLWDCDDDGILNRGELYYMLRIFNGDGLTDDDVWKQVDLVLGERGVDVPGDTHRGLSRDVVKEMLEAASM